MRYARPLVSDNDDATRKPEPCMPCRGTGKVISKLGGHERKVACPWCHGEGVRLQGADAQDWRTEQDRAGRTR